MYNKEMQVTINTKVKIIYPAKLSKVMLAAVVNRLKAQL
jgi:hypothetical protein